MSSKLDDLIEKAASELARDVKPVKRLPSPWLSALGIAGLALIVAFSILAMLSGVRGDVSAIFSERSYVLNDLGLVVIVLLSSLSIARARVPGANAKIDVALAVFLGVFTIGLFALGQRVGSDGPLGTIATGYHCSEHVAALALPLIGFGAWFLLRGAPVSPWRAAIGISGFAVACGALVLPLACRYGDPMHLMLSHLWVPLVPILIVSILAGRRLLRW